ncbi:hypothetical protein Moror_15369 [Moniliophthora roreri MCA 2997]|uniref:Uncharacterized protein n=1 Tax=Moniliophthora roreri (strain MCA 2997) TaxID=1381753 RepID=V2Y7Y2_MONRO|nr:hypothetical protein Moror_15369 [Moniliophthora roreri MCA 2997]
MLCLRRVTISKIISVHTLEYVHSNVKCVGVGSDLGSYPAGRSMDSVAEAPKIAQPRSNNGIDEDLNSRRPSVSSVAEDNGWDHLVPHDSGGWDDSGDSDDWRDSGSGGWGVAPHNSGVWR